MDIREALRASETWALVAGFIISVLGYHRLIDPAQAVEWANNLFAYAALRFVSKTVKASIPATNGGSK